jgi:hypothetical protein
MSQMIRAKAGSNDFVKAFNPVPLVTGTTPANEIRKAREEKTDAELIRVYLDNWTWYSRMQSRKAHAAGQILGWKIEQLGGMGAAW